MRSQFLAVPPLVALLLTSHPAAASGTLSCTIADKAVNLSLEGSFSHGVGEGLVSAGGTLELKSPTVRTTRVEVQRDHITQYWMHGPELKLRIYHEPTEGPHEEIDIVIETRQADGSEADEPIYSGTYQARLYRPDEAGASEPKTETLTGPIECSAGF